MARALILGITGQDGSYLAEELLKRGDKVHGLYRRSSTGNLRNIEHILNKITLHEGDITDHVSLHRIISQVAPDVIYNEADQDHVGWSYKTPIQSMRVTAEAVVSILEIIKQVNGNIRFFQPCSATMFGGAPAPQNEETPFNPQSPYAIAKTAAYHAVQHYRNAYGIFASTAIMYSHDSPRRGAHHGSEYLLHNIVRQAIEVNEETNPSIVLGRLNDKVDIGWAPEFMEAVVQIMEMNQPEDFVIASDQPCTVGGLAVAALQFLGVSTFPDCPVSENALYTGSNEQLVGDISKAQNVLGFNPRFNGIRILKELLLASGKGVLS